MTVCRRVRNWLVFRAHDRFFEITLAARALMLSRKTRSLTYSQAKFWLLFLPEREILRRIINGDLL